jgi:large subunit ribosomal protein L47
MRSIKHVLTERFYAWEDARELAENDPEVNLSGDGPAFVPQAYLEEADVPEGEAAGKTTMQADSASAPTPDAAAIPPAQAQTEAPRL